MASRVLSVIITGNATGAKAAFKELGLAGAGADTALGRVGTKIKSVGGVVASAGAKLTKGITLPVVALGAVAVKSFADFNQAMTESTAIMGDLSDKTRQKMEDTARAVALTTTFSAKEAAESYFFLASAGLDAAQSMAALPKVAKFAQAGAFDMATATDLLTDAQSALGLTIRDDVVKNMENMIRVSDVLVKANTLANATVEQFSQSLTNKAGAALKVVGKDLEEGTAVLAAFADQGVKGQVAGNALAIVLRDLQTASIKNKDAWRELGVAVFDSNGELRNMGDIVADLEGLLDGMSDRQKKVTLAQLGFQDRSQAFLLTLLGTSDSIKTYEDALRDAGGTTDDVANKQMKSFTNQMKLVKDAFVDAFISIGEIIVPFVQKFAGGIKTLVERFRDLSPEAKETVVRVAAIAAAVGPVVFIVGKFIGAIGSLVSGLVALGPLFGPIAVGLGLITFGFIDAWLNAKKLETGIKQLGDGLVAGTVSVEAMKEELRELAAAQEDASLREAVAVRGQQAIEGAIKHATEAVREQQAQVELLPGALSEAERKQVDLKIANEDFAGAMKLLTRLQDQWLDQVERSQEGLGGLRTEYKRLIQTQVNATKAAKEEARERRRAAREARTHAENMSDLEAAIRGVPDKKHIDLKLDTKQAMAALRAFQAAARGLEGLGGRVVFPNVPGGAHGGIVRRSGLTVVGEVGAELLRLPAGAEIWPMDRVGAGGRVARVSRGSPLSLTIHIDARGSIVTDQRDLDRMAGKLSDHVIRHLRTAQARSATPLLGDPLT